ncbi:hypothetical protein ACLOJK_005501 [Asimina triloba]
MASSKYGAAKDTPKTCSETASESSKGEDCLESSPHREGEQIWEGGSCGRLAAPERASAVEGTAVAADVCSIEGDGSGRRSPLNRAAGRDQRGRGVGLGEAKREAEREKERGREGERERDGRRGYRVKILYGCPYITKHAAVDEERPILREKCLPVRVKRFYGDSPSCHPSLLLPSLSLSPSLLLSLPLRDLPLSLSDLSLLLDSTAIGAHCRPPLWSRRPQLPPSLPLPTPSQERPAFRSYRPPRSALPLDEGYREEQCVGDPVTNDFHVMKGMVDFAWSQSVISDEMYVHLNRVCDFKLSRCFCLYDYLNRPDIQKSLHASVLGNSEGKRGLKIWVYSGDTDGCVSVLGTRYCMEALGLPVISPWRYWYHHDQVEFGQAKQSLSELHTGSIGKDEYDELVGTDSRECVGCCEAVRGF